jgi:hypothetical protein
VDHVFFLERAFTLMFKSASCRGEQAMLFARHLAFERR